MKEKMVLINPCKAYGEGRYDARVPLSALVPGLRLTLPLVCAEDKTPLKTSCVVRHVHYSHHWIRAKFQAAGKKFYECIKFAEEGEE